jgi:hypothetical protein
VYLLTLVARYDTVSSGPGRYSILATVLCYITLSVSVDISAPSLASNSPSVAGILAPLSDDIPFHRRARFTRLEEIECHFQVIENTSLSIGDFSIPEPFR